MSEETRNNEEIHTNEEAVTGSESPPQDTAVADGSAEEDTAAKETAPGEPEADKTDQTPEADKADQTPEANKAPEADSADKAQDSGKALKDPLQDAKGEQGKEKKKEKKKKKKRKKGSLSTILLVVIMLVGVGIFAYPSISDWWNSMHATQAIAGYVEAVESLTKEEKEAIFAKAVEYNESLPNGVNFNISDEQYAEYASILDITGTGIMGYVQIPSIGVNLPVYHGVDEGILQIAVGHIPGSSFPIGGERTHAVMSGHRGLPSAKLFSDLDKVKEGDIFTMTVLDETFTYMVDQIRIVLPEETDELGIVEGKEYATLVTCTPYGVNSHRILMRGHRIANLDGKATPAEAVRIPTYIVIPAVGIPLLFIVLVIMLIYYRRKRPGKTTQEMLDDIRKL